MGQDCTVEGEIKKENRGSVNEYMIDEAGRLAVSGRWACVGGVAMIPAAPSQPATTVVVALNHRMMTEMVSHLLAQQEWISEVAAAESVAELSALESNPPDVIVLSPTFPDGSGTEWLCDFKRRHPDTKAVFLADANERADLLSAVATGAEGYLLIDSPSQQLIEAVRCVAGGDYVYDSLAVVPALRWCASACHNELAGGGHAMALSPREREIAILASAGLTNKAIAERAFISVNTVKTHLRRIYQRLGITSRRQLLGWRVDA